MPPPPPSTRRVRARPADPHSAAPSPPGRCVRSFRLTPTRVPRWVTCGARFGVVNLSSRRLAAPRRDIAGNRDPWVVLRGARGRDRTLRLPVIRLRPRAFCGVVWDYRHVRSRSTTTPSGDGPGPGRALSPSGTPVAGGLIGEAAPYSITSSARARSVCGTMRPSALAVFRLMTSSTFVDCTIGSSAGFLPPRARPA